jgi:hypothetical protein
MLKNLFCLALLGLLGCKDADTAPTIDFGPNGGITERDNYAYIVGETDPTDWTQDATWNSTELGLFSFLSVPLNGPGSSPSPTTTRFYAYPNPASREVVLNCSKPDSVTIQTVVVDRQYRILRKAGIPSLTASGAISYVLNEKDFPKNQLYRIYYVLYSKNRLYSKGHGDFKVVE